MMILVILIGIIGAFLVASPKSSVRFWGFQAFVIVDISWVIYGNHIDDVWLVVQFTAFLVAALVGVFSNLE